MGVADLNHRQVNDQGLDGGLADDQDLTFDIRGQDCIEHGLLDGEYHEFVVLFYRKAHRFVGFVAGFLPRKDRNFPAMQSILIIRLSSLGDVILATALVRQVNISLPHVKIDVAVDARFADVWAHNPRIRRVFPIERSVGTDIDLTKGARHAPYDCIVDLQKNRRSRRLIASIDPPATTQIVSVHKHRLEKLLLVWLKMRPKRITSIIERYWKPLARFGVDLDARGPEVWSADGTCGSDLAAMTIGIAPGARHNTKRWPAEGYAELIRQLVKERQQQVMLLGGPDDVQLCDRIAELAGVPVQRADGARDLAQTVQALESCRLVVSNDSAVMHLAAARQRPVVAIFGSTVRELGFAPTGDHMRIVERDDVSCRPCSHIGRDRCPKGHFNCMRLIGASDVLAAIDDVMRPAP